MFVYHKNKLIFHFNTFRRDCKHSQEYTTTYVSIYLLNLDFLGFMLVMQYKLVQLFYSLYFMNKCPAKNVSIALHKRSFVWAFKKECGWARSSLQMWCVMDKSGQVYVTHCHEKFKSTGLVDLHLELK